MVGNLFERSFDATVFEELVRCIDLDEAIEFAENELLAGLDVLHDDCRRRIPLADQVLCQGLDATELALLESLAETGRFAPGESICSEGDAADELYFSMSGRSPCRSGWILAGASDSVRRMPARRSASRRSSRVTSALPTSLPRRSSSCSARGRAC